MDKKHNKLKQEKKPGPKENTALQLIYLKIKFKSITRTLTKSTMNK